METLRAIGRIPDRARLGISERFHHKLKDLKPGEYVGFDSDVAFIDQLAGPDEASITREYGEINDVDAAIRFGARNLKEYSYWAWRSCGIANVHMILENEGRIGDVKLFELVQKGLMNNGYAYKNKWGKEDVGWKHDELARLLNDHGCESKVISGMGMQELLTNVSEANYVIASVKSKSGGHMALIKGASRETDGSFWINFHDPYVYGNGGGGNLWIREDEFRDIFTGRGIVAKAQNDKATRINDATEMEKLNEHFRILNATGLDRLWWKRPDMFFSPQEVASGLEKGQLTTLDRDNEGLRLIGILNNAPDGEPNWIRPGAWHYVQNIVSEWLKTGVDSDVRLAVTSLGRTLGTQSKMISSKDSYRAASLRQSSHLAGATVDISLRSYYRKRGNLFNSIASWNKDTNFDPMITEKFLETAQRFSPTGDCNICIENIIGENGSEPSVLHICVNPRVIANFQI